jgi:hypothetical protein
MKKSKICMDCVKKLGGKGNGSIITFSINVCPFCGEEKETCSTLDYDWPDGTKSVFD